jgi:hypothetical protein
VGKISKSGSKSGSQHPRVHAPAQETGQAVISSTGSLKDLETQTVEQIAAPNDSDPEDKMMTDSSDSGSESDGGYLEAEEINGPVQGTNGEMMEVDS